MDFTVRRFDDAARVEELLALVHGAFRDLQIDPPSSVLRESAADFLLRLRSETCFVVEVETRLVGSVFCARKQANLYIGRLAVAPDWRRSGVASALIEAAKGEARRLGVARVTLSARIALTSNVALFRARGFEIVRETCHPGFTTPTSCEMEFALT